VVAVAGIVLQAKPADQVVAQQATLVELLVQVLLDKDLLAVME
jgi:hypothetical protein